MLRLLHWLHEHIVTLLFFGSGSGAGLVLADITLTQSADVIWYGACGGIAALAVKYGERWLTSRKRKGGKK